MLRILIGTMVFGVAALLGYGYYQQLYPTKRDFHTEKVTRADVTERVAVTGVAEPLDTRVVQADMPTGAMVTEVLVDFNQPVVKDQILAKLDDRPQTMALTQAESVKKQAGLAKKLAQAGSRTAAAAMDVAKSKLDAAKFGQRRAASGDVSVEQKETADLAVKGGEAGVAVAESEGQRAQYMIEQADLSAAQADNAIAMAKLALEKAAVRAPIAGFVLNRNITVGQIVGRPTMQLGDQPTGLFEIAASLATMRAVVKVSEADRGKLRVGQKAKFTIDAFPDERFDAVVKQIRQTPTNDRSATTYPVVLEFANRQGKDGTWMVWPRSTVSADIEMVTARGVLTVPNTAIYFTPSQAASLGPIPSVNDGEAVVWVVGAAGLPVPKVIVKGITDGGRLEVRGGLGENDAVIVSEPKPENGKFEGLPIN